MPRDRGEPPAVRVYTVCDESRYLIVRNVPSLGCGDELSKLFGSYGKIEECKPMDAEDCEPFTDVYWIKFSQVSNARFAKRKLDESVFLGNQLQVSYAPQFESLLDTKEKLEGRRKEVLGRIKFGKTPRESSSQLSNYSQTLETSYQHLPTQAPSASNSLELQISPKQRNYSKAGQTSSEGDFVSHVSSNKEYFSSASMNETVRLVREKLDKELFHGMSAAALVIKKKDGTKHKKKKPEAKASSTVACCYGCGAPLQTTEVDAPGYVDFDTYELKKRHRQLRTILCGRCRLLSHGQMVTAVCEHGGYPGGKQFVSAEELREKLSHLRHEKVLIVKLVDIIDFNGSFLARIRDLAGANPIILVITKIDLLPKGTDLNCIGDWVVEATTKKKLNVISIHLTSSKSLVGIAGVISKIQKEKKGRDVYILGSANVGKSAFVNALLKMMSQKDPVAAAARKYKPMQSAVPGTTLGPIEIEAFLGGGKLFDTPGVHLHHRQAAVVHSEDLPSLAPQSRLRGQSFPAVSEKSTLKDTDDIGLNGFSLFWGGLVRIDVIKVLPRTRLTFYGPRKLQIHIVLTVEANEFYHVISQSVFELFGSVWLICCLSFPSKFISLSN